MAGRHFGGVLRRLERLFAAGSVAGLSEGQLLERFVTRRDEAAFEAILARHGPMVLGICRRVLRDPEDVEDAFQATFLVLVRRAGSLRDRDLLGNWLFGVASRVALRARVVAARRQAAEGARPPVDPPAPGDGDHADLESGRMLHEEVRRLPEKYRVPVLLCYLEGLTHEEAARQLGWPVGTVKGRLARARDLMRRRMSRRGVVLSVPALSAALAGDARGAVPAALVESTGKAALAVAAGRGVAVVGVAANVVALMEGASRVMFLNTLKGAVTVLVAGAITTGAGVLAFQGETGPRTPVAAPGAVSSSSPAASPAIAPAAVENADRERAEVHPLLDAAHRMFDSQWAAYLKERIAADRIAEASRRWLEAQLSLGTTTAERVVAYEAYLERMRRLEAYEYSRLSRHQGSDEDFTSARFLRLQAERMLADSRDKVEAPPVAAASGPPPSPEPVPPTPAPPGAVGMMGGGLGGFLDLSQPGDRIEIAKLAPRVLARDRSPRTQAIVKALEEPIAMSFAKPTALKDVLRYIKAATAGPEHSGLAIYVDPLALAQHNLKPETPVALDLEGVPLKTSLRLLLKQLGLAYCVKDGLLMISSPEGILQELKEAEPVEEAGGPISFAFPPAPAQAAGPTEADGRPSATTPAEPSPREDPNPDPVEIRSRTLQTMLGEPISLAFPGETPLEDVLQFLKTTTTRADGTGIAVFVDPKVKSRLKEPVQIDLPRVPLRTALTLLLDRARLSWHDQDGLLIISTSENLVNYQALFAHLAEPQGPQPAGVGKPTYETLKTPITLSFPGATPLDEVLKAMRRAAGSPRGDDLPIYLGPPLKVLQRGEGTRNVFETQLQKIGELPVAIDVKDIPLRTCLVLVLSQYNQGLPMTTLDCRVDDGLILIGSREWLQQLPRNQGF
jgi:RNA polymerase sigma factor (sigma-70 family)